ncbi:MAG: AraC family transcriptional regulator [Hydrocarboniphaga sp.]|uniref:AraC family transcriptional regulator n=1 Tax=Hydrocarboniphaga sp. TaxID=2033016 RepID=UPI0026198AB8|nr:AraC family transcriptional regulator [Hydrocarboniphaga sp.]MDB5969945.1 AraC family transcriptional regulator [Hydrocarboniphaga sp.]
MWQVVNERIDRPLVSICFVHSAIKKAQERGYDWRRLLAQSNIAEPLLTQQDARVTVESYAMLQKLTMQEMRDESLGYAPQPHKLGLWSAACGAAVHPGPMGHALGRLCKIYSLFDWGLKTRLVIEGEDAVVEACPRAADSEYELFAYELCLSTIHRFTGWLINEAVPLKSVTFRHPRPEYETEYGWLFQRSPIFFDRPRAGFRFERQLLEKPIQQNERTLEKFLDNGSLDLLDAERSAASWAGRLRDLVSHYLPELPEFERLAAQLKMHPQTLRRRLAVEGITYKDIKDQVRREAAEYYLREHALSVEEIAFRSGFSEASAFIRAFKRWNGVTPHTYAESQRQSVARAALAPRHI